MKCSENGCERGVYCKGLCYSHYYRRLKKYKTTAPLPPPPTKDLLNVPPGYCRICGAKIKGAQSWQLPDFCSKSCKAKHRVYFGTVDTKGRLFNCKQCGKEVVTGEKDRRSVFCSAECEKKYWRLASKEKRQRHKYNISGWQIKAASAENKKLIEEVEKCFGKD